MKKFILGFSSLILVLCFMSANLSADTGKVYSPSEIKATYEKDSSALDGKEATVKGQVNSVQLTKANYYISLRDGGAAGYDVYCEIEGPKDLGVKVNSVVSVKGTVTGKFFKSIQLKKCQLVK